MTAVLGAPIPREGAAGKVTGTARYAADLAFEGLLHAALVTSTVARGRLLQMDAARVEASSGVRLVLTHANFGQELAPDTFMGRGGHFQSSVNPLASPDIAHFGQIIALVVADSQEAAEHAAAQMRPVYAEMPAVADLDAAMAEAHPVAALSIDVGPDWTQAAADAAAVVDATYTTPVQHQNPIEPYVTTARWDRGRLEVHLPSQWVAGTRKGLGKVLGLPAEHVRVLSPHVGGAFGAKASVFWHTALVAVAARRLQRPVRLVVSRPQMFTIGSFRPATRQHVRLAADSQGLLLAYHHGSWGQTSRMDSLVLPGTETTARIYAAPSIRCREHVVPTDVNTPGFMRAPIEMPAGFALESAMDELAVALRVDPIHLRLLNEARADPVTGLPFSSRGLAQCWRRGAALFGWARRTPQPGSMKDAEGRLVGWGCAAAWYPVYRAPASARVRLFRKGRAEVAISAHDLGQGAATVLKQIAAASLGMDVDAVSVSLGDSDLPVGPMAGGSSTTASAGSAVQEACREVLRRQRRTNDDVEATIVWAPGELSQEAVEDAMTGSRIKAGAVGRTHVMFSFGAHLVEVFVEPGTRRLTLGRMVGVFDCGRIINPTTTRSNLAGGMIWGASGALMEETAIDIGRARFANTDLGSYHFACNADIAEVTVETIEIEDTVVNPLGVKSVGEIGVVGVGAAIANAVHHATGRRVRKLPILLDDLA